MSTLLESSIEMNSFKEEEDDNFNGIDGHKNCNAGRGHNIAEAANNLCNNDASGIKTEYTTIVSDEEDFSNTTLSGEKPFLSHRVCNIPQASLTNPISYMELNDTTENLSDSNLGTPNKNALDIEVNPSESLGNYQCFLCPSNFVEKNYLSQHLIKHFDRSRPFMCQVCEKTFPKMENLKTHINGCADIRPYQCEQCDEAFTTSSQFSKHKKKNHSSMSPLKCAQCDYKTFQLNDLNRHIAVHMDERPFKCNYCSYTTKAQRYLTWHEQSHKDDKRYKCDICYSRFRQSRTLRDHRKKHFWNGLTIHRCSFCPSDLDSPDALRKHVENVHRDEVLK